MVKKRVIIRATTVPRSLSLFKGTMEALQMDYEVQLLSSSGQEMVDMGLKFGVKTHSVEMYRRMSPIKDLRALFEIIKVFRREKPFMVHSMTPKAGLLCMMAAWWARIPVRLHTFTGLVWPTEKGLKKRLLMFTDRITCFCATHVIPEGEGVKNDMLNNHITKKPIRVLGYGNVKGVDMVRFSKRPEVMEGAAKLKDKRLFSFLFVGRIVRDKGINELCEAFESLNKRYPNSRLLLVGGFENDIDPISNRAKTIIENNPSVYSEGPKYDDDLLAYYAASDCFVFPSYREGFPNTVLEAGAMDLPCIVTDINGSREIIVEGENGTVIPPMDAGALYKVMERMITDEKWRENMVRNARSMIMNRYEQGFVQRCLMDFYCELLSVK